MNQLLTFLVLFFKIFQQGGLGSYPDPDPPSDLGTDLTQEEKDWVKKMKKEMQRFSST